jgi:hypothetical protein
MFGLQPKRGLSKYPPDREYRKEVQALLYAATKVVPSPHSSCYLITFITDTKRSLRHENTRFIFATRSVVFKISYYSSLTVILFTTRRC